MSTSVTAARQHTLNASLTGMKFEVVVARTAERSRTSRSRMIASAAAAAVGIVLVVSSKLPA
jgi:hypothetical protein